MAGTPTQLTDKTGRVVFEGTQDGGGGSQTTHGRYATGSAGQLIADGMFVVGTWAYDNGDALLDLTDPTLPTVITAGVYALSTPWNVSEPITAGGYVEAQLDVDLGGPDYNLGNDITSPHLQNALSFVYAVTAGAVLRLAFTNNDGGAAGHIFGGYTYVQRLA